MRHRALALIALCAAACPAPAHESGLLPPVESSPPSARAAPPAADVPAVPRLVRKALARLGEHQNPPCDVFDYFPRGGMRSFYCHLKPLLSYQAAAMLAGVPVYIKGPHSAAGLDLKSRDFGHYNPAFVKWLGRVATSAAANKKLLRATLPVYRKNARFLALHLLGTHAKLRKHPAWLKKEIRDKHWARDYERYFFFMNPRSISDPGRSSSYYWSSGGDGDGYDGNVVKTCVAFWIRRTVDGTAAGFHQALRTMTCAYDRALVYQLGERCPAVKRADG